MRVPGLRGLSVKAVGKRLVEEVSEDDCAGQAAQLAYYFLFALFPLLLFLVTLLGYLPVPDLFDRMIEAAARVLPPQALSLVRDTIGNITSQRRGGLLSIGALVALWSASAGFRAIMSSLNRAYDVEEARPWWKYYGVSILATVGFSVLAIVAFALLIFGPQIGHALAAYIGLGDVFDTAWGAIRWPVALVLLTLVLAGIYYVAPNVEQDFRWLTPGSALAVVGWVVASVGFSIYVQNFGSYDKTYGSVGAVIVLLTWLYLTAFLLLVGGETNAVIEHLAPGGKRPGAKRQAERGTTRGPGAAPAVLPPEGDRRRAERRQGERRGGQLYLVRREGAAVAPPPEARGPVSALDAIQEAGRETRRLVTLQARLASSELRSAAGRLAGGASAAAAGVVVAGVGLLYLCAAAVVLLGGVLPLWLAALVVSAVGLLASAVAVRLGLGRVHRRATAAKRDLAGATGVEGRG